MERWLEIAAAEQGVHEYANGDHPRIIEYLQTVDLPGEMHDEIPWCSAFANWVMTQAGIKGTGSAAAVSWLKWGKPITLPMIGAVVILRRGDPSWQGHVGFVMGTTPHGVLVLGGNQANAVNIREYPFDRVRGYRWPRSAGDKPVRMMPIAHIADPLPRKTWRTLWGLLPA